MFFFPLVILLEIQIHTFPFRNFWAHLGFGIRDFSDHTEWGVKTDRPARFGFWSTFRFLEYEWIFMSLGHLWYQLSQCQSYQFFSFRIFWISELWLKQSPDNKIEHQYPGCGCELGRVGWAHNSFTRFSRFLW